jgi:Uma2 family endonuclease
MHRKCPYTKGPTDMTQTSDKLPVVAPANDVPGPKQGFWTYDDYAAIPGDGKRYEILNGVLYMSPSQSWSHQEIVGEIFAHLRMYTRTTGSGGVFMAPIDVELAPNTTFQPDVVVLLKASQKKLKERHIVGAPDLVVEVVSPGSETHDRHRKIDAYARAGVPEYWIVDPDSRTVEVLTLEDGEYHSQGVYRGKATLPSQIVPGLLVHVEQFFVSAWKEADK